MIDILLCVENVEAGRAPLPYPVELPVGRLPRQAANPKELARKIAIVMALRLEDGKDTPVAISARFAARLMHLRAPDGWGAGKANGWLKSLETWGVIRCVGELPARGHQHGARCYEPGDRSLADIFFDGLPDDEQEIRRLFPQLDLAEEIPA